MTFKEFDTRGKMAVAELTERLVEAALNQPQPSEDLRGSLQRFLTYTKHNDRDRTRDRQRIRE